MKKHSKNAVETVLNSIGIELSEDGEFVVLHLDGNDINAPTPEKFANTIFMEVEDFENTLAFLIDFRNNELVLQPEENPVITNDRAFAKYKQELIDEMQRQSNADTIRLEKFYDISEAYADKVNKTIQLSMMRRIFAGLKSYDIERKFHKPNQNTLLLTKDAILNWPMEK